MSLSLPLLIWRRFIAVEYRNTPCQKDKQQIEQDSVNKQQFDNKKQSGSIKSINQTNTYSILKLDIIYITTS